MLHHALHKKLSSQSLVLYEDEVTSTVFGPLAFMPSNIAWGILNSLFPFQDISLDMERLSHSVRFWPRYSYEGGSVSPDIEISFAIANVVVRQLAIEVKWQSGASNPSGKIGEQLARQVLALRHGSGRLSSRTDHIYLVRHVSDAIEEIEAARRILSRTEVSIELVTWRRIREWCQGPTSKRVSIEGQWAVAVDAFLDRCGVPVFSGFESRIALAALSPDKPWNFRFCR